MSNRIEKMKVGLSRGGAAKSSKYRVLFSLPNEVTKTTDVETMSFMCKAASFPSVTIGQIEVWNQGRKLPIPGDTSYETTWNLTFYNDVEHSVRRTFLSWMAATDNFQENWHSGNPGGLFVDMTVQQLDSQENPTAVYTFHNCFPNSVGEIQVTADGVDQIQEFDVVISFSDWVVGVDEKNDPKKLINNAATNVVAYS